VAKTAAGKMVILKFTHEFGLEREPLGVAIVARPAAGAARSLAGKAGAVAACFGHERFQNIFQFLPLFTSKAGAEADVIKLAFLVVQAEQQRADLFGGLLSCF